VLLPDYLDTTDILMRNGHNEVTASTTGRWDERLSQGLTHAVGADLTLRLPQDSIVLEDSSEVPLQLLISIDALDVWLDGRCVMAANWRIIDRDSPLSGITGSATFVTSPEGSAVNVGDALLVDAISRTVGKLADTIASSAQASTERAGLIGDSKPLSPD
jgi:uncharacterized lipoprotein YmbA